MNKRISRRELLRLTGATMAAGFLSGTGCRTAAGKSADAGGVIIGETNGAAAGMKVLAEGGNAVDAVVTAALVSAVASPAKCGIGGYGGHATIALARRGKVVSIDFNSTAPAAARTDMYPLDEKGEVKGRVNYHGWLAAGVPGTLAGLELALKRHGTRSFREVVQPAIALARDGAAVDAAFAQLLRNLAPNLRRDPALARLYLRDNQPLNHGDIFRNPDLAAVLTTLAERNSTDSFYRGDIAQRIAEGFQKNGGLVTVADLAAYEAQEIEPTSLSWKDFTIHTAPLTAGGVTILEAFGILRDLNWEKFPADGERLHAKLEALRVAWRDRLELLGDPTQTTVPWQRLLSEAYAQEWAGRLAETVKARQPLPLTINYPAHDGTVNLSCADRHGNLVALTLTHGSGFGAQVAVDGLGLCLGHGMSRFNPHPNHPNSPGPRKRPLHNMCPTVVLRGGKPLLALGGAGGVRIPNSIYDVLTNYVLMDRGLDYSLGAPRLHCTGLREVEVTADWPVADADYLRRAGYTVRNGATALVSAVEFDNLTRQARAAHR